MEQRQNLDMTQGSPARLILRFSLPLIAGNMLQQLYNMVDSIVVGQFVGPTALAAVGSGFPVIFLMASLFMGFGSAGTIMISQYYGGNEPENLRRTVGTLYTAMLVGAVPVSLLGVFGSGLIVQLLNVPADAAAEAHVYIAIALGGLVGSLGYNVNAGILQGIGDSKTPLLFLAIACGINIVLDLLFVIGFGWDVAGVAIATIIAQVFSWVFGIFYINKKYPQLKIRPFSFLFDRRIARQILRLGVPASIQQAMFSIGVIVMTRLVNDFGSAFAAGYNAANKVDTFAFFPINSMAIAMTTYTGQNIGAGKPERVKAGTRAAIGMSIVCSVVGLLVIPLGPYIMRLFSDVPEVIDAGMAFLLRIMPFYWVLSISFMLNSTMRGAGSTLVPTISSIVGLWLARLPAAYLLAHYFGPANMHFCFVVGWVLGLTITGPYYLSGRWKNKGITTRAGEHIPQAEEPAEADGAAQQP